MPDVERPDSIDLPPLEYAAVTQTQVSAYALASGDDNPIHTDLAIARSAGLSGCVVPGMLIVGQFETAIRRWRPDARLAGTSTRFVRPLLVGQSFTVHGRIIDGRDPLKMIWRILVRDEMDRIVCISDARIVQQLPRYDHVASIARSTAKRTTAA